MNEQKSFQQEYESGRKTAVTFASFVYTGAVVAGTTIFIFFVLTAFPSTAYFIRFLMVLAGLLVGASALAFPIALHNWAVSGAHRNIATAFYYGEICLIILNTVVSFSTLLFKYAGNNIPDWVQWYEPFTIFSLGYVVLAWGTIFITDPQAKAKAREKAVHDNFIISVAEDMEKWTHSVEGREQIQKAAMQKIIDSFSVKSNEPEHWIKTQEEHTNTHEWQCVNCKHMNSGKFCAECGMIAPVFSSNGKSKANP